MGINDSSNESSTALDRQEVQLRGGHVVEISSSEAGATLRLRGREGDGGIEIEIGWSPQGPVARLRAARIDLEATADVSVRCNRFEVQAAEGISLTSRGDLTASAEAVEVEARTGRIVARANDDVQLLGEQILLNCDRSPAVPDWVTQAPGLLMGELIATVRDERAKDEREADHVPR